MNEKKRKIVLKLIKLIEDGGPGVAAQLGPKC